MSAASPNRLKGVEDLAGPGTGPDGSGVESEAQPLSPEEAAAIRSDRLDVIKKAIEAGAYDSEELLDKAMARLRESIENDEDSSTI